MKERYALIYKKFYTRHLIRKCKNQICPKRLKAKRDKKPGNKTLNKKGGHKINTTTRKILSHIMTVMKETLEEMIKEERQAY
ncbi:MAG: hypothetical protein J7L34_08785, partial [Thermotogaceae bacterium]|nr:hypothetical protein [Thermotogaceae bacterium]